MTRVKARTRQTAIPERSERSMSELSPRATASTANTRILDEGLLQTEPGSLFHLLLLLVQLLLLLLQLLLLLVQLLLFLLLLQLIKGC